MLTVLNYIQISCSRDYQNLLWAAIVFEHVYSKTGDLKENRLSAGSTGQVQQCPIMLVGHNRASQYLTCCVQSRNLVVDLGGLRFADTSAFAKPGTKNEVRKEQLPLCWTCCLHQFPRLPYAILLTDTGLFKSCYLKPELRERSFCRKLLILWAMPSWTLHINHGALQMIVLRCTVFIKKHLASLKLIIFASRLAMFKPGPIAVAQWSFLLEGPLGMKLGLTKRWTVFHNLYHKYSPWNGSQHRQILTIVIVSFFL